MYEHPTIDRWYEYAFFNAVNFRIYLSLKIITCSECGINVIIFRPCLHSFILALALILSMRPLYFQRRLSLVE